MAGPRRRAVPAHLDFRTCVRPRTHIFFPQDQNLLPKGPLRRVPGAWVLSKSVIRCPDNAAHIVRGILQFNRLPFFEKVEGDQPRSNDWRDYLAPEMRPRAIEMLASRPYQQRGLLHYCHRPGALNATAPGAGKTLVFIAGALAETGPAVFVVKASTKEQIQAEVLKHTFLTEEDAVILEGETPRSLLVDRRPIARIFILSWQVLPAWIDELEKVAVTTFVADEVHLGKGSKREKRVPRATPQTYRCLGCGFTGALETPAIEGVRPPLVNFRVLPGGAGPTLVHHREDGTLCASAETLPFKQAYDYLALDNIVSAATRLSRHALRRLGASGTPQPDRTRDIWGIADILEPGMWGTYPAWTYCYVGADRGEYGWDDKKEPTESALRELKSRLDISTLFIPEAITRQHLPRVSREVIYLPVNQQNEEAGEWKNDIKAAGGNFSHLFEIGLMQAASRKRSWIVDRAVEDVVSNQKVLIFTGRIKDSERLFLACKAAVAKLKKPVALFHAHGGFSSKDRRQMVLDYAAIKTEPAIFVATGQSMGESIDGLQSTNHLIMAMTPWTPKDVTQWSGRVTREGQDRPCRITFVICTRSADEHVADLLISKLPSVDIIMGEKGHAELAGQLEGMGDKVGLAAAMVERFKANLEREARESAKEGA